MQDVHEQLMIDKEGVNDDFINELADAYSLTNFMDKLKRYIRKHFL